MADQRCRCPPDREAPRHAGEHDWRTVVGERRPEDLRAMQSRDKLARHRELRPRPGPQPGNDCPRHSGRPEVRQRGSAPRDRQPQMRSVQRDHQEYPELQVPQLGLCQARLARHAKDNGAQNGALNPVELRMGIAALLLAGSNQRPLARTTLASHMTTMTDDRVSGPEETTVARPYAFLFDASADDVPKTALPFFSAAVLSALSEADPDGATRSQFRNGLPSLGQFAARTTAVHAAERSTGRTISYDMDTYKYVVWDWLDSLSEGWSTVDREKGEAIFWRRTEECVALTDLADPLRDEVDRRLHDTPGYVGAFAIDLGNPIHRGGFLDLLSRPAAI